MNRFALLAGVLVLALGGVWFLSTRRAGPAATQADPDRDLEPAPAAEVESPPAAVTPPAEEPAERVEARTEEKVPPAPDPEVEVAAPTRTRALLRFVEAASGEPLVGFRVQLETYGPVWVEAEHTTDAEGRLEQALDLPRGKLHVEHLVEEGHPRFGEPWAFAEEGSLLFDLGEGEAFEHTLHARPPMARVQVDVLRASGRPALGARVQLAQGQFLDGVTRWDRWRFDETDAEGRARFYLHDPADVDHSFRVSLREPVGAEVSEVLVIGPPLDEGPHLLQLYPGSELEVLVTDGEGKALTGLLLGIRPFEATRRVALGELATDERGRVRFTPLAADKYGLYVRRPEAQNFLLRQEVEVGRERLESVHVQIPAELLAERLIVAGRVIDPDGNPVEGKALAVSMDGAKPEHVFTDADGGFVYRSLVQPERVTIYAVAAVHEGPVEPERVDVEPGTEDLVFREAETEYDAVVLFEVVDARTGENLVDEDDVAIRVYREPDEHEPHVASAAFGLDAGSTEVEFAPRDDLRWLVTAPGFREQRGDLAAPGPEDAPPIVRVALEPGFHREIVIRDQVSAQPLGGVAALDDDGNRLATSGFDGQIVLTGDAWPEWITFELAGYTPLRWRSRSHWFFYSDRFWMEPLPIGDGPR